MKNYVKSEKGYEKISFDTKKVKAAYKKLKSSKKFPTSINLPQETVAELKSVAAKKGLPYQTLMRTLVIEGLERMKKAA
ncbi:MAG: hypothetical protein R3A80_04380 [Bdellovibrionota bacterium]